MVRGLEKLKEYFKDYSENFIIIGGTACDILIDDAGFTPRATKDIDIILIVEALNPDFVGQFWHFVKDGDYERNEKGEENRQYYRFVKPSNAEFPFQLELFARNPDILDLNIDTHLTPIPVDDDLSSLSAILLDDIYYQFMIDHSLNTDGVQLANIEALICLKAKAYLDIAKRIKGGGSEDSKHLKKHKADVFRLAVMLTDSDLIDIPAPIKADMQQFIDEINDNLPPQQILKNMGLSNVKIESVLEQIKKSFGIY